MKKALSLILVLAMMLSTFALLPVSAEEAAAPVAPNLYEVEGVQTITVPKQTETAPKADGVLTEGEYTTVTTLTKESAGVGVMAEKFFTEADVQIGYVKLAVSHDDDAIYFAIVVQEDNFKYGTNNVSLQVLADDDGDSISAVKQWESTLRLDGSAEAPIFFAGTSNYAVKDEATGATNKLWTYLGSVHGEGNNRTPANAKYRWFARGTDADGKAITTYEIKYTMSDMKKFFGADNDFSRITIKLNAWSYNAAGQKTGRLTYWNAPNEELKAKLEAAYGFAPSTYGNVIVLKNPNVYEAASSGQETLTVPAKANKAPVADGVLGDREYALVKTYKADGTDAMRQMFNAGFTQNEIGYVKLAVSYDDDAVYFAIVVQEDNFIYGKGHNNISLQLLGDDDGDWGSASKQLESTLYINGTEAAPTFFAGTSYYTVDEATGTAKGSNWGYLNTVHGEKNDPTPATAKCRYFARGTDADGKAITTYEIQYKMSVLKQYYGEDNDFSRIAVKLNAWSYNAEGKQTGRWVYWQTPSDAFKADLIAAYGYAPSTIGHVINLNQPTVSPATADNSNTTVYVLVGVVAIVALVSVGTVLVVDKKRRAAKIEK